jgi:ATP-binding cassette, subfamily B, bacterial MsbA
VIAHRMSTVRNATRIVVLEAGRITEMGSHEHLIHQSGTYRRLYDLQFESDRFDRKAATESAEAEVLEGIQ